jgi:hypothetical protein
VAAAAVVVGAGGGRDRDGKQGEGNLVDGSECPAAACYDHISHTGTAGSGKGVRTLFQSLGCGRRATADASEKSPDTVLTPFCVLTPFHPSGGKFEVELVAFARDDVGREG